MVALTTNEKKQRSKQYVDALKSAHPCADCGDFFPPCVMDYDHVRGEKRYKISDLVRGGFPISTIDEEISKCDLVCANCHRIRTNQRGYEYPRTRSGKRQLREYAKAIEVQNPEFAAELISIQRSNIVAFEKNRYGKH